MCKSIILLIVFGLTMHLIADEKEEKKEGGSEIKKEEIEDEKDVKTKDKKLPKEVIVADKIEMINPYDKKAKNSLTRSDVPLSETPRSIQIINKEVIDTVNAKDLRELFRYMVGVTPEAFMAQFFSRGFRTDHTIFIDGMKNGNTMEHYNPRLNNVESVESHRGPSGTVYGPQENPGGLINIVTKRPQAEFDAGVKMEFAEFNTYSTAVDVTGAIDSKKRFLYRFDGVFGKADTFRDEKDLTNFEMAPAFAYVLSENTRFDLQYTYIKDKKEGYRDRGVPFINNELIVPIENTTQEPTDYIDSTSNAILGIFSHSFQDESNVEVKIRYLSNTQAVKHHQPDSILDDGVTMKRYFRNFDKDNEATSLASNYSKSFESENFKHHAVVGFDYLDETSKNHAYAAKSILDGGQVGSIDIFNPVFGQTDPSTYVWNRMDNDTTGTRTLFGLFMQYQLTAYKDLHFMGSVRFEHYDDETDSINKLTNKSTHSEYDDNAFSFRGGLMYQFLEPIGVFISYDQTYQPQSTGNQDPIKGGPFNPEESYQYELGAKTHWFDKRLNVNLTFYHINKQHTLQGDPLDNTKLKELGEVQSRGVEVEIIGIINENWWVTANYAHNHVEITEDRDPANIGKKPLPPQPDNSGSFWLNYRVPKSWNFGIGMNFVDSRGTFEPGETIPEYVRWDVSLGYEFKYVNARLFVENLENREYYTGGYGGVDGALPGAPRTFGVSAEWRY